MALLYSFSCAETKYVLYVQISVTEHEMQLYELSFKMVMNLYLTTGSLCYYSHLYIEKQNRTMPLPENPLQHQQELWKSVLLAESEHYLKSGRGKR